MAGSGWRRWTWSPFPLSLARLHLHERLRHQLVHLGAKLRFGRDDTLGVKVAGHLADRAITVGLEIGRDHVPSIGAGGVPRQTELVGHPQPKQLVAAGFGLEFQLLVENKFALESLFAPVECGHDLRFRSRAELPGNGLVAVTRPDA